MTTGIAPDIALPRSHSAKRLCIIEAAARVFCREGFAGANIDLIAAEAGVSRQTVYNHHGDKEKLFVAVVQDISDRTNAAIFETLSTFPDRPDDLEADLVEFAVRLNRNCVCNSEGRFLRKLLQAESDRYPELFSGWCDQGPAKIWAALGARFARLAHAGLIEIDEPDMVARQFLALINADLQMLLQMGRQPSEEQQRQSAQNAVRMFLRAYGKRP
ncbi:TetR/AcrR family transcriptional regulator [Aquamicrobium sp. LC103]|uniref:TetR/AcrR family transcriptional regulator n=1 Tax=Aquamicrobium sp. LC103 TaxID=1120658 RepID=UPI00063E8BAF|nr:TetR/AcrR family transcriptional regulator [Aquamicrobium sp. LC103]TKT80118.1 TetR/AcrR family transcriptional regulator [Aquamicrobium sp. LC103]